MIIEIALGIVLAIIILCTAPLVIVAAVFILPYVLALGLVVWAIYGLIFHTSNTLIVLAMVAGFVLFGVFLGWAGKQEERLIAHLKSRYAAWRASYQKS